HQRGDHAVRSYAADVVAVWKAYCEATERTGRYVLTPARRRLIEKRLAEYDVADLTAACRGWQHIAHNRGENAAGRTYNELELLLRDAAHVERFRDAELAAHARHPVAPAPRASSLEELEAQAKRAWGDAQWDRRDPRELAAERGIPWAAMEEHRG